MAEFLVLYEEPRLVGSEQRSWYESEGHALVVEAENELRAFIVAFDLLTRRGHMVRTMKAGESLDDLYHIQEQRRQYDPSVHIRVVAGLMLDQMKEIYQSGVPVIGGRNDNRVMTNILSVQLYDVTVT